MSSSLFRSALAATALLTLAPCAMAQDLTLIEQRTLNGTVVMTGNTLGLSGYIDSLQTASPVPGTNLLDQPGQFHSIFTFLADHAPGGSDGALWPTYTTGDWHQNFSTAPLDLSAIGGGRVVKVYLLWAGSCRQNDGLTTEDVSASVNSDVVLEIPTTTGTTALFVTPDVVQNHCGQSPDGYVAWADITGLHEDWQEGTYGVGGVPGTQNMSRVGFAGWTLMAVVENPITFPEPHQATLWAGWVPRDADPTTPSATTTVDGFCYPATELGDPNPGRLLVTAAEGDAVIFGDYLYFGRTPTFNSTNLMWGPRNWLENFFGSQLVNRQGDIIPGGTNLTPADHRPWLSQQCAAIDDDLTDYGIGVVPDGIDNDCMVAGARQGWDIADVPINDTTWNPNILLPGDTTAYIQPGSSGDAYSILGLAMDLPSVSASITTSTSAAWTPTVTVNPGAGETDTASFTVPLTNEGSVSATRLTYRHAFPTNVSALVSFSTQVNGGAQVPATYSLATLASGVSLAALSPGNTITVRYTVEVSDYLPADPIQTRSEWQYDWSSCADTQSATVASEAMDIDVLHCVDADRDGLCVGEEDTLGTDDNDRDSDEDGITDGDEVHVTLTDPSLADTDADGLQDGTELGYTSADIGPDTNVSVFVPDADPSSTTNPNNADTDGGTTRDGVEDSNLNGRVDGGECNPNNPADDLTCTDADNDGLADDVEITLGTDPYDDDTDNDGLIDGWEVTNGTDPTQRDTDGDGVPDGVEVGLIAPQGTDTQPGAFTPDADPGSTTDPRITDTDGDGLSDGAEDTNHNGSQDPGETDPEDDDTDDDGLLDGNEATYGADPLNPDTDGDGLSDGTEVGLATPQGTDTDPTAFHPDADPTTTTDPNDDDTDDGSVSDGTEDTNHNGRIDPFERDPNDPSDDLSAGPDCDNDGLSDIAEQEAGTDPCDPDSDHDGIPDLEDELIDTDGDGQIDALDTDSDNDGIPDGAEDLNGDGVVDPGETDPDSPDLIAGGACSSVPAAPAGFGLALLAGVTLLRRRRRAGLKSGAALLALAAASVVTAPVANAQDKPLIDVQRFDPVPQPDGFVRLQEPNLYGPGTWSFALAGNYAYRPLQLRNLEGDRTGGLIDHMVGGDITATAILARGLQLGFQLPVMEWQRGPLADNGIGVALGGTGNHLALGDLAVTGAVAVLNQEDHGLGILVAPKVVFPTGANGQFVGIGTYGIGGTLSVGRSWDSGFRFAFNYGYQLNLTSQTLVNLHPDDEMSAGLGIGLPLGAGWELGLEVAGATSVSPFLLEEVGVHAFNGPHTPLELSIEIRPASNGLFRPIFGGGPGLNTGFGTPVARGFAILRVSNATSNVDTDGDGILDNVDDCPADPEDFDTWQDEDGCPDVDNDSDSILDVDDRCPLVAEDPDGFEDLDGCPDEDNDADGIFDSVDACPLIPELYNGVEDEDGCPEGDEDGDGLYDNVDACPSNPEDFDHFEDEDGCPDLDNDQDTVLDVDDACPDDPEDFDQFEDEDGCPDLDNDQDTILDIDDACPLEPETMNGNADDDGCPDSLLAQIHGTQIIIYDKVYFDTGRATIKPVSFPVLDAVFDILESQPAVTLVEIQGHTDSDGSEPMNLDLSQRRAEAVRDYLIGKGTDGARLAARGYGEGTPIETNDTSAGKAANRRVEFHIATQD